MLLRLSDGSVSRIDLAKGSLPRFGETIDAVGFPETDLYRINFSRAIWRPSTTNFDGTDAITNISARSLISERQGQKIINASFRHQCECGFHPDACPGILDGHFGLQGIRERVSSFEGEVQIESSPGKGTRVSISINAPQTEDESKL